MTRLKINLRLLTILITWCVAQSACAFSFDLDSIAAKGQFLNFWSRFNFEFSSALFSGCLYSVSNKDGMALRSVNKDKLDKLEFKVMNTTSWGIDITYFFNHRRYSNQAAYSFGKIQKKSQGAYMSGLTFQSQKLYFDLLSDTLKSGTKYLWNIFSCLPDLRGITLSLSSRSLLL